MSNAKSNASAPASFPVRTVVPRRRIPTVIVGESRTKQSMRDEVNINNIMARYQRTGALTHLNRHGGQYGYAPAADFREALEIVRQGQAVFEALPSSVRSRFRNDPAEFLAFVQDPQNLQEAVKLGLAKEPTPPPPPPPAPSPAPTDAPKG